MPLEKRQSIYSKLTDPGNPLEFIFVSDVLNEGVDVPSINTILFLRPTESATIFVQQLGRGLRLYPDCEVLTVLDFVGHHKAAWLPLACLHDPDGNPRDWVETDLDIIPPLDCEVVLDVKTKEIMRKLREHEKSTREKCLEAYKRLVEELDRPYPVDLLGRMDCPEFAEFRSLGTWIDLRKLAEHAQSWEMNLPEKHPAFVFLKFLERDWQLPRVYPYALIWAIAVHSHLPAEEGYALFFKRFPRWQCEFRPLAATKAWESLEKRLPGLLRGKSLSPEVLGPIPSDIRKLEVEGRIRLFLEKDFRTRHGGILRQPSDLSLHRQYDRPEIVNHFQAQYDPSRHNPGVIDRGEDIIIISKLDTRGAHKRFQYTNHFVDDRTFSWQSQNQQRRDNEAGRRVIDHAANGVKLHLFVQTQAGQKAYYCGLVEILPGTVRGDAPFTTHFRLRQPLSSALSELLVVNPIDAERPADSSELLPLESEIGQEGAFRTHLPVYTLKAAAGYFGDGQEVDPEGWIEVSGRLSRDMFVAHIEGCSMEPRIPDGSLAIFRANPAGSRNGKIVLASFRGLSDPETAASYTVKVYSSKKAVGPDGSWAHTKIALSPTNTGFEAIEVDPKQAESFRIIAEFVRVVGH